MLIDVIGHGIAWLQGRGQNKSQFVLSNSITGKFAATGLRSGVSQCLKPERTHVIVRSLLGIPDIEFYIIRSLQGQEIGSGLSRSSFLGKRSRHTIFFSVVQYQKRYTKLAYLRPVAVDPGGYLCNMKKLGILGGGQLGRMLLQAGANYTAETFVLENDPDCPAAKLCHHFQQGDIRDYQTVLEFGRKLDVLTIEIEQVNVDALEKLEQEGITVIPKPAVLRIIQNKIQQKEFYRHHDIPTAPFHITSNSTEVQKFIPFLPAVHKLGVGGYDGKGVTILNTEADLVNAFDEPAVLEKKMEIHQEIAVMVAVAGSGEVRSYPAVEMIFNSELNLLDFQACPANISIQTEEAAAKLAEKVVCSFGSAGLFAVEMFVDSQGGVWVNEIAPRVHNSGHHTIEAHYCSQFDMLWRILMGFPLGNTDRIQPSVMINLIGEKGSSGEAVYEGLDAVLRIPHAFLHLYGKKTVKPGRKMGHITLMAPELSEIQKEAMSIKQMLRVRSY